jgi:hypothetical protein
MKRTALIAAVGALGLASTALAAMPATAAPLPLMKAAYWCGPGWHPNAWGRCVPNRYGYGYYNTYRWDFGRDRGDYRDRYRGDFRDRGDRGNWNRGDNHDRGEHRGWR